MRVLRGLKDGRMHAVPDLTQDQMIPQAFTYKIMKKLDRAGLVEIVRGSAGGCRLKADLEQTSLADLMTAMEGSRCLSACSFPDIYFRDIQVCHETDIFQNFQSFNNLRVNI